MNSSRMNAQGQVTLPREIRERLGLEPGDVVDFAFGPGRTVILRARNRRAGMPADQPVVGVSREEMHLLLTGIPPGPSRTGPQH